MDAFWFVDFSFLSLFSQEAEKAAGMCVCAHLCVCVYVCLENTVFKPWHQLCEDGSC